MNNPAQPGSALNEIKIASSQVAVFSGLFLADI
jgi:hypothetical protein